MEPLQYGKTTLHRMLVNIHLTNHVGLLLQTDSISPAKEINLQSPGKQHTQLKHTPKTHFSERESNLK